MKDAFPKRPRPCPGNYYPNGDFRTDSGRLIQGPLCKVCAGLVTGNICMACGAKQ